MKFSKIYKQDNCISECSIDNVECYYLKPLRRCPLRKDGKLKCVHKSEPGKPLKSFIYVEKE